MALIAGRDAEQLLKALAAELLVRSTVPMELFAIGGAALTLLGLVDRPTKDIDVIAIRESAHDAAALVKPAPMPLPLAGAIAAVAGEFGIEAEWLNAGPADLLDHGLPDGFADRTTRVVYGSHLAVHYASRVDQICFKTYAAADSAGRHLTDLLALAPTRHEMAVAFRWTIGQDPSEAFGMQLTALAEYLGVCDVLDDVTR